MKLATLFPKTVNRRWFYVRFVVTWIMTIILALLTGLAITGFGSKPGQEEAPSAGEFVLLLLFALVTTGITFFGAFLPRLRHVGFTKIESCFIFIPLIGLFIGVAAFFAPENWWLEYKKERWAPKNS